MSWSLSRSERVLLLTYVGLTAYFTAPLLVTVNSMSRALHAPYVRDFAGFDRPWRYLEQLVEDVQVRELAFGAGYVMTGHTPA